MTEPRNKKARKTLEEESDEEKNEESEKPLELLDTDLFEGTSITSDVSDDDEEVQGEPEAQCRFDVWKDHFSTTYTQKACEVSKIQDIFNFFNFKLNSFQSVSPSKTTVFQEKVPCVYSQFSAVDALAKYTNR